MFNSPRHPAELSMKPSKRINEIYTEICKERDDDPRAASSMPLYLMAIQRYLDEEYEKKQEARDDTIHD